MSTPEGGFPRGSGTVELGGVRPAAGHDSGPAASCEQDGVLDRVTPPEGEGQAGGEAISTAVRVHDGARQGRRPEGTSRLDPAAEGTCRRHDDARRRVELTRPVELAFVLPAPDEGIELDAGLAERGQLARGRDEHAGEPCVVEGFGVAANEVD